jgi:hypothetical protein
MLPMLLRLSMWLKNLSPDSRYRFQSFSKSRNIQWHGLPGHSAELSRSPREDAAKMAVPQTVFFGQLVKMDTWWYGKIELKI